MMIEKSEFLEIDLKAEDNDGKTGYQLAKSGSNCCYKHQKPPTDVINLIKTKMPCLAEIHDSI